MPSTRSLRAFGCTFSVCAVCSGICAVFFLWYWRSYVDFYSELNFVFPGGWFLSKCVVLDSRVDTDAGYYRGLYDVEVFVNDSMTNSTISFQGVAALISPVEVGFDSGYVHFSDGLFESNLYPIDSTAECLFSPSSYVNFSNINGNGLYASFAYFNTSIEDLEPYYQDVQLLKSRGHTYENLMIGFFVAPIGISLGTIFLFVWISSMVVVARKWYRFLHELP